MPVVRMPGLRPVNMGALSADMETRPDGVRIIRSRAALEAYPRSATEWLKHWAEAAPERSFLADRGGDGAWRHLTYGEALRQSRGIAQALLDRGVTTERPLMILSGNSIEHGLLALGCMIAGIAYAPLSPAYSLVSTDHAKLKHIFALLTPGLVFAADKGAFAGALDAVAGGIPVIDAADVRAMAETQVTEAVDEADAAVDGDTVAKFLFTSGSTGMPKAVINTQRMICCNQIMISTALAFLRDRPPVMVDWLPWNHTAGGNHNFGIALANGGTLHIDDGSPTPAGILKTVRNLEEIAPTLYFNVPKGYEMLTEHLARNERLRRHFFSEVELLQYAGAGLAQHVWDALERLAVETTGRKIMIVTGYGSTETAPFASTTTWPVSRPGEVGLPAPGLTLKLVPQGEKLELRLKGPSITPGYWRQPDKTAECFDDEGFYRIGDALKPADAEDIDKGLLFDGRVAEDFKLATGTWVNMAGVRGGLIRAFAPYVRDAVLTGLDRGHIGALLFLDADAARRLAPDLGNADEAALAGHPRLREHFQACLDTLAAQSTGTSTLVARAIVLDRGPAFDRGEVTDKGSINQRAVMATRAALVENLYAEPPPAHVLVAGRGVR